MKHLISSIGLTLFLFSNFYKLSSTIIDDIHVQINNSIDESKVKIVKYSLDEVKKLYGEDVLKRLLSKALTPKLYIISEDDHILLCGYNLISQNGEIIDDDTKNIIIFYLYSKYENSLEKNLLIYD